MADVFLGPAGDDPQSVEVRRLGIRPGDRIVLKLDHEPCEAEVQDIRASLAAAFGDGDWKPPVLLLGPGAEIGVIGPEAAGIVRQAALAVLLESGFDPHNARAVLGIGPEADGA